MLKNTIKWAVAATLVLAGSFAQAREYKLTWLTLPGGWSTYAHGINDHGQVAGYGPVRAVVWNGVKPTALQSLSYADRALAINDMQQAVGISNAGGTWRAALWNLTTGEGVDLNTFLTAEQRNAGWELSSANGINNRGVIVGTAYNHILQTNRAFQLAPVSGQ
jgi:uncharacterized membrane protein